MDSQQLTQLKQRIQHLRTPLIMKNELLKYFSSNPTLSLDVAPWDVYDTYTSLGYSGMANMSLINIIAILSGTHSEYVRAKIIELVNDEAKYHMDKLSELYNRYPLKLSMEKLNEKVIVLSAVISYEKYGTPCQLSKTVKVRNTEGIVPQRYFDYFDKSVLTLLSYYEHEMSCVQIAEEVASVFKDDICDLRIVVKGQTSMWMSFEVCYTDDLKKTHRCKYNRRIENFEQELRFIINSILTKKDELYKRSYCSKVLAAMDLTVFEKKADNDTIWVEKNEDNVIYFMQLDETHSPIIVTKIRMTYENIGSAADTWYKAIEQIYLNLKEFATNYIEVISYLRDMGTQNEDYEIEINASRRFYGIRVDFSAHARNQSSGIIRKGRCYQIMTDIATIAAPRTKTYQIITRSKDVSAPFNVTIESCSIREWLLNAYEEEKMKFDNWFYKTEGILDVDEVEDKAL